MFPEQSVFAVSFEIKGPWNAMVNALRCLVIGIPAATFAQGSIRPEEAASIAYDAWPDYGPLPEGLELVVAPLFCNDFDALEIMEGLGARGYRGLIRVVTPKLPNQQVVLRELRAHAVRQGITLEMIEEDERHHPARPAVE